MQDNHEEDTNLIIKNVDILSILGMGILVATSFVAWYLLGTICHEELVATNESRYVLLVPFLLLISFYLYRDFYRMIKSVR